MMAHSAVQCATGRGECQSRLEPALIGRPAPRARALKPDADASAEPHDVAIAREAEVFRVHVGPQGTGDAHTCPGSAIERVARARSRLVDSQRLDPDVL